VSSVLEGSFESGKFFLVTQNSSVVETDSSRIIWSQSSRFSDGRHAYSARVSKQDLSFYSGMA
jgi:hypothetical protein